MDSEILFESLVNMFGLPVSLGMIAGGEVKRDTEKGAEGTEEMGNEFATSIGRDGRGPRDRRRRF